MPSGSYLASEDLLLTEKLTFRKIHVKLDFNRIFAYVSLNRDYLGLQLQHLIITLPDFENFESLSPVVSIECHLDIVSANHGRAPWSPYLPYLSNPMPVKCDTIGSQHCAKVQYVHNFPS